MSNPDNSDSRSEFSALFTRTEVGDDEEGDTISLRKDPKKKRVNVHKKITVRKRPVPPVK